MTDTAIPTRVEPTLAGQEPAAVPRAEAVLVEPASQSADPQPGRRPALDQLSRIEEKAARLEEKYARSEAHMLRLQDRLEAATGRMGETARQADLVALKGEMAALANRTQRIPGFGTLLLLAILTAILSAGLTAYILTQGIPGYLPGVLPR